MGASRVVLAREVSLSEMADIRKRWISNWKYSAMGRSVFPGAAAVFYPIILQTGNASPTGANASRHAGLSIP